MEEQLKCYFFSFSFEGENQGCCNVKAETPELALQKTIDLDIHPKHDPGPGIFCAQMIELELPENTLMSSLEMKRLQFKKLRG
jgi:hypothetical protein